ncbi:AI-2E family transporter [Pseudoduganella umbonata]|uniref:AI-2E family transporter n=1 Tax=Pseudoduganella umbonata TaxID=864828 RepID=A0A4P8HRC6_9BURK|nr:AI-2E family transporter [Pseudoduganella umbonata]MBB3222137.1 putative PurR-regulated permease PerM [Pseudoduganella umbonata]QCP12373.1 AI-2E family transporter [Pseudoduganella umbonata]
MVDRQQSGPIVWCGIVAATCVLLYLLQRVLWLSVPFLLAIILYYMLLSPFQRLLRMGFTRNTSAMLVGAGFVLAMLLAVLVAAIWIPAPATNWQDMPGRYLDAGVRFLRNVLAAMERQFPILRQARLGDSVNLNLAEYSREFFQRHLADVVVAAAAWVPSLLLAPFLAFFFLRDGRRFKRFLARAVPNAFFEKTLFLLHEVDQTARRYFHGMLKLTIIDTIVLAIGLWAIGLPSPLLLGFIAAMLAWVPYVGSIAGCLLVVLVASADAPDNNAAAYSAIFVFIIARLLDDFVFMPMTLGRSLRMHPLVTVVMLFVGGALAGVTGLMLVLPLLGVTMVVGETIGVLITDARLQARHRYARSLRVKQASVDLK